MNNSDHYQFPVPAVRAIISNSSGKILLLKRANSSYGNAGWCLPGGKIDYGQTVEDALARELDEETSLKIISADFFFYQNSLPLRPGGMHCLNLYFVCKAAGELQLNSESSDFAWVGADQFDSYEVVFRHDEAIKRFFLRENN